MFRMQWYVCGECLVRYQISGQILIYAIICLVRCVMSGQMSGQMCDQIWIYAITCLVRYQMSGQLWIFAMRCIVSVWSDIDKCNEMSGLVRYKNICYEVQDNPGNCILAPVKLLPSVIFPLNRALYYAQTARWTVTELHVSKSPGSNSLGGCCWPQILGS